MRLTAFLWRKKMPNGHIWRGKHRLYKTVSAQSKVLTREAFEAEERNMLLLRFPYLTLDQSSGHAQALGKPNQWNDKWIEVRNAAKQKEHITLVQRLGHLKVKENWD